ncbi:MAG: hypothetical protein U1U88_002118 [Lawsonella clevelandensis]
MPPASSSTSTSRKSGPPSPTKPRNSSRKSSVQIPTQEDWKKLRDDIMRDGIYNQNLQAIPPPVPSPTSTTPLPRSTRLSPRSKFARKARSAASTTRLRL